MSYLNKKGGYYEGDKQPDDINCQARPDVDSVLVNNPLSDPMNCWRDKTPQEITAEVEAEKDVIVDFSKVDPFLKAYALGVNDGSITPGMTNAQLKAAVRAKL